MNLHKITGTFRIDLKSLDLYRFEQNREYIGIASPFSRLYLITKGSGWVEINQKRHDLEAGNLYLIPSFIMCNYYFSKGLEHYFAHFSTHFPNGFNVYYIYKTCFMVKSSALDYHLFDRLYFLNPNLELKHHDPQVYQSKNWMNRPVFYSSSQHYTENQGLLLQLFSRFMTDQKEGVYHSQLRHNLFDVFAYIHDHVQDKISISELAEIACISTDHFIRIFRKHTDKTPKQYVIEKKLERAQYLMLTTDLPLKRIIEESGFQSLAYFSRIFKQKTLCTPNQYRRHVM